MSTESLLKKLSEGHVEISSKMSQVLNKQMEMSNEIHLISGKVDILERNHIMFRSVLVGDEFEREGLPKQVSQIKNDLIDLKRHKKEVLKWIKYVTGSAAAVITFLFAYFKEFFIKVISTI